MNRLGLPLAAFSLPVVASLASLPSTPAWSQDDPIEAFYRGKTVNYYIGSTPGGGYDLYARLIARHLGKYIPGNPMIVPRNMPGGSGRVATGYVHTVVPKDGLSIATAEQSLPMTQALDPGSLQFDTGRLNWIGSPSTDVKTIVTWHTTGVRSIEDARKREVTMGATTTGSSSYYPKVMNALLGTRFKVVVGYSSGPDINVAMERGEVEGRSNNAWGSWKTTKPDWVRDRKINLLVQIALTKASDLPDVPLLTDFARGADDLAMLRLLSTPAVMGHPVFTSPGVPAERVQALRKAFDATVKDPAFLADAKKARLDVAPNAGADLQRVVAEILSSPTSVRERLASIIGLKQASK